MAGDALDGDEDIKDDFEYWLMLRKRHNLPPLEAMPLCHDCIEPDAFAAEAKKNGPASDEPVWPTSREEPRRAKQPKGNAPPEPTAATAQLRADAAHAQASAEQPKSTPPTDIDDLYNGDDDLEIIATPSKKTPAGAKKSEDAADSSSPPPQSHAQTGDSRGSPIVDGEARLWMRKFAPPTEAKPAGAKKGEGAAGSSSPPPLSDAQPAASTAKSAPPTEACASEDTPLASQEPPTELLPAKPLTTPAPAKLQAAAPQLVRPSPPARPTSQPRSAHAVSSARQEAARTDSSTASRTVPNMARPKAKVSEDSSPRPNPRLSDRGARKLEIRLQPRDVVIRRRVVGEGDDAASREQRDVLRRTGQHVWSVT